MWINFIHAFLAENKYPFGPANLPPRSEAGKYTLRWKPSTTSQNLRLWLFQGKGPSAYLETNAILLKLVTDCSSCFAVISVALPTKIYCGNTSLHCSRGIIKERIWWKGNICFILSQNGKEREQKKLWGLVLMSKINGQCFYLFHHYRLQMFGLVGLPYMWCLLVLIHLKILMIQEISGKQLRLVIYDTGFKLPNSFLLHLWFLSSWDVDCLWQRILSVHYSIPDYVRVSMECKHLLSRIFVANPEKVIN